MFGLYNELYMGYIMQMMQLHLASFRFTKL